MSIFFEKGGTQRGSVRMSGWNQRRLSGMPPYCKLHNRKLRARGAVAVGSSSAASSERVSVMSAWAVSISMPHAATPAAAAAVETRDRESRSHFAVELYTLAVVMSRSTKRLYCVCVCARGWCWNQFKGGKYIPEDSWSLWCMCGRLNSPPPEHALDDTYFARSKVTKVSPSRFNIIVLSS